MRIRKHSKISQNIFFVDRSVELSWTIFLSFSRLRDVKEQRMLIKTIHKQKNTSNYCIHIVKKEQCIDERTMIRGVFPVQLRSNNDGEKVNNDENAPDFLYFDCFVEIEFCDFTILEGTGLMPLLPEFQHSLLLV